MHDRRHAGVLSRAQGGGGLRRAVHAGDGTSIGHGGCAAGSNVESGVSMMVSTNPEVEYRKVLLKLVQAA